MKSLDIQVKLCEVSKTFKESDNFLCRFSDLNENYTLEELGELNHINPEFLLFILLHFEEYKPSNGLDVSKLRTFDILNYLLVTHNHYRERRFNSIEREILNLYKVNWEKKDFIKAISEVYCDFKSHLSEHMKEEDDVLFPLVEKIAIQELSEVPLFKNGISTGSLSHFTENHEDETDHPFFDFVDLSLFYDIESTATLIKLENKIKGLKKELTIHSWVEEKVLMKKIKQLNYIA